MSNKLGYPFCVDDWSIESGRNKTARAGIEYADIIIQQKHPPQRVSQQPVG